MNKALLIGINEYPFDRLRSCVNDVQDMAAFLFTYCHFDKKDITVLNNQSADKENILVKLKELIENVSINDRIVFFYSGHGAQFPSSDAHEVDHYDEAICPVLFNWDEKESCILDKELYEILSVIPLGVNFVWISDSCFSGDLCKSADKYFTEKKTISPPPEILDKIRQIQDKGVVLKRFTEELANLNLCFISACQSGEEAVATKFNNRLNGVLTYYLLKELKSPNGLSLPLTDLLSTVSNNILSDGFKQVPTIEGHNTMLTGTFLNL